MPIISQAVFEGITDRMAYQGEQISLAVAAGAPVGGGLYFTRVTNTDDYEVENPLITPANNLDNNYPNFSGVEKSCLNATFNSMVSALDTHMSSAGAGTGITTQDAYMTYSGINVSYRYDDVYNAVKNAHLDSINVFGPQTQLARVATTASGVGSYTRLSRLGTGSGKVNDRGALPNYAGAQFEAIAETLIGANDLQIDVHVTKEDGSADSVGVTIPGGTTSGTGFNLGSSSDDFIDTTNIAFAGGNNGDSVVVVNKLERDIEL